MVEKLKFLYIKALPNLKSITMPNGKQYVNENFIKQENKANQKARPGKLQKLNPWRDDKQWIYSKKYREYKPSSSIETHPGSDKETKIYEVTNEVAYGKIAALAGGALGACALIAGALVVAFQKKPEMITKALNKAGSWCGLSNLGDKIGKCFEGITSKPKGPGGV